MVFWTEMRIVHFCQDARAAPVWQIFWIWTNHFGDVQVCPSRFESFSQKPPQPRPALLKIKCHDLLQTFLCMCISIRDAKAPFFLKNSSFLEWWTRSDRLLVLNLVRFLDLQWQKLKSYRSLTSRVHLTSFSHCTILCICISLLKFRRVRFWEKAAHKETKPHT